MEQCAAQHQDATKIFSLTFAGLIHHPSAHPWALRRKYILWRLRDKFSRASVHCDAVRTHRSVAKVWRKSQEQEKTMTREEASVSLFKNRHDSNITAQNLCLNSLKFLAFCLLTVCKTCTHLCFLDLIKRLTRAKIHKLQHRGLIGQRCGPSAPMFRWGRFCLIVPVLFHRKKEKKRMHVHPFPFCCILSIGFRLETRAAT